jgi:hypothetical protein
MKPIGQTFFTNEPPAPTGVQGVYITRIDVYFQKVSPTYGVEIQIRTTENGQPTANRLPFASKNVLVTDTIDGHAVIRASQDASIATPFIFDTPVFVQSGKSYAFVILPHGGNPDYNIWTAQIGQADVTTKSPIYTNNDSGDLFLSSNDIAWQPVINEDIKYVIYTANFTTQSGTAYYITPDEDWIQFKDETGAFQVREEVVFGNNYNTTVTMTVSGTSGTISTGDTVYQQVGSANVSGIVYYSSGATIKIANATGAFSTTSGGTPLLYDANTSANTSVSVVNQNVITTSTSNVVSVPDSSVYSVNNVIFIQTNNRSSTDVVKVTALPTSTSIQVNTALSFTENNALIGRVIADGALTGRYSGHVYLGDRNYGVLDSITATSTRNLSGAKNKQIIGLVSKVSANLIAAHDPAYNSVTTHFTTNAPGNTNLTWAFKGFANDTNRTADTSWMPINDGTINEFIDVERIAMSRSNEYGLLPVNRSGNNSVVLQIGMTSQNNKISPVIDVIQNNITYTYNIVAKEYELKGYYLTINTNSGTFTKGDVVSQTTYGNTTTGYIHHANSTYIMVTNCNGKFISNAAFTTSNSVTGFVYTAEKFSESNNNPYFRSSRYISKNVVLAQGQDSEDLRAYLAAYRPDTTNVFVYAKVQSSLDNEQYNTKEWTKLEEKTAASLISSKVNINDQVELIYGFPTSQNIFLSNTVVNNATNTVFCQDTAGLSNNMFVYFQDNNTSKTFNVREIVYVVNTTAFVVDRFPSFNSTNAALGYIPTIESTSSAFLYDQNSNIVRYSTPTDAVYDNFIQFSMKIVPTAENTALVPRVGDIRVLALQV